MFSCFSFILERLLLSFGVLAEDQLMGLEY